MYKKLLFCVIIFAVAGCKQSDKEMINTGESVVRDSLKNPASARFASFYKASGQGRGYVCGKVNAKDERGTYTGSKPYYVYIETEQGKLTTHSPAVIVKPGDAAEMSKYSLFCQ